MTSFRFRSIVAVTLAAVVVGAYPAPASPQNQSPSELRQEIQRLNTLVADLRLELEAAREEIQSLQQQNALLRERVLEARRSPAGPGGGPGTLEPDPVTIDESVPEASPRALLTAIVASYAEATAGGEMGADADDPQRAGYLRQLRRWASRVNRQFRSPIEWHVRTVAGAVPVGRGYVVRLQAIDPRTATELGDPFDANISRTVAGRLRDREQRRGLGDRLILKGVLRPRVHINEERLAVGPFDNPRFIGPFAEFGLTVDVQTFLSAPEPEQSGPDAQGEGTDTAGG